MRRFTRLFRLVLWSVVLVVAVREILTPGYLSSGEPEPLAYTVFTYLVGLFAIYRVYTLIGTNGSE